MRERGRDKAGVWPPSLAQPSLLAFLARQGNATDHCPTMLPTPTLQGVTRPVLPASRTLAYLSDISTWLDPPLN